LGSVEDQSHLVPRYIAGGDALDFTYVP
jgi:hypothetical protein